MVLIGLLLVAAICVAVGFVLSSVGWIVAALAVCAVAAGVMVWSWVQSRRAPADARSAAGPLLAVGAAPARTTASARTSTGTADTSGTNTRESGTSGTGTSESGGVTAPPAASSVAESNVTTEAQPTTARPAAGGADGATSDVYVIDGEPLYHLGTCVSIADRPEREPIPLAQALEDGFSRCAVCSPPTSVPSGVADGGAPAGPPRSAGVAAPADERAVLVVDGRPDFHLEGCRELAGLAEEAIPLSQALEDGFAACLVCRPTEVTPEDASATAVPVGAVAAPAQTGSQAGPASSSVPAGSHEVWVADGYPEYHVEGCTELAGLAGEPVPYDQAREDGFQPCVVCNPDRLVSNRTPGGPADGAAVTTSADDERSPSDAAGSSPAGDAEPASEEVGSAQVWVVDGFPDYHREGCSTLVGLASEPVPHDQAVEDGFAECSVCRPEAAQAPEPAGTRGPDSETSGAVDTGAGSQSAAAADAQPVSQGAGSAQVWVVDGFPDYHREGCSTLVGLASEPVPHDQAVEDGFAECTVCRPEAAHAPRDAGPVADGHAETTSQAPTQAEGGRNEPAAADASELDSPASATQAGSPPAEAPGTGRPELTEVWVVDGFPDYHRGDCPQLTGLNAEPVPHDQAVEDGFAECSVCQPEAAQVPTYPAPELALAVPAGVEPDSQQRTEPAAEAAETGADVQDAVWVADGFPEFHRARCSVLAGLPQVAIPRAQAVEDGFRACAVCRPDREQEVSAEQPAAKESAVQQPAVEEPVSEQSAEAQPVSEQSVAAEEPATEEPATAQPVAEQPAAEQPAAEQPAQEPEVPPVAEPDLVPEHATAAAQEQAAPVAEPVAEPASAPEPAAAQVAPDTTPTASREDVPVSSANGASTSTATVGTGSIPAEPSGVRTSTRVWVVDGRPRFHVQDCLIIKGQAAQPISRQQAESDGFLPCSLCQRQKF